MSSGIKKTDRPGVLMTIMPTSPKPVKAWAIAIAPEQRIVLVSLARRPMLNRAQRLRESCLARVVPVEIRPLRPRRKRAK